VVARAQGQPVEVTEITLGDPGPGEVLVRVEACGVCHTDVLYREGGVSPAFPFLLGHEAAGRVAAVGAGVSTHEPGDFVVLAWRAPCGACRSCVRGKPWYCFASRHEAARPKLADGTRLSPALGLGAFARYVVLGAGGAIKVDARADAAAAGLVGCGVMAGWGAAVNTGAVTRGETVAVFGCGGVGSAAIAGASMTGAAKVIAVDIAAAKLDQARGFGATDVIDSREVDPVEAIRDLTGGHGVDLAIDAVGRPDTFEQAFYARDHAGRVVLVGVPDPSMRLDLGLLDLFSRGGTVRSSWYGDCLPTRDFPLLIDAYLNGEFPLEAFVSERIGLGDVEEAFARMDRGEVLRSVVTFDASAD
jgi:S-(hydroxymethyl)mycothiol dehydrogenase